MERHLRGLRERADEQQQAGSDDVVAVVREQCGTASNACRKSTVPVWSKMMNVPITSPTSPTTLITNALMPARVAVVRRYQNEISMYEAAPTNAQPTISSTKLPASTSSSIENTK